MTPYSWKRHLRFVSRLLELQLQSQNSQFTQKSQSWSFSTDNVSRVCDKLFQNDNRSDWGKETIHLQALPEYSFKLLSSNKRLAHTKGVIVSSFKAVPLVDWKLVGLFNSLLPPLSTIALTIWFKNSIFLFLIQDVQEICEFKNTHTITTHV